MIARVQVEQLIDERTNMHSVFTMSGILCAD